MNATTKLAIAFSLISTMACGQGQTIKDDSTGVVQQAWTVPDDWTCDLTVWEDGGPRKLSTNSFRIEPGDQVPGTLKVYGAVDPAMSAIATVKSTGTYFDWTSTTPVRAIIASAGPGKTTIYDYRGLNATSGYGVTALDDTQLYAPQYMLFCFDAPQIACTCE